MRGTSSADPVVESFPAMERLPRDALALLNDAAGLFGTVPWWKVVLAHAIPADAEARFVVVRCRGRVTALVPMLRVGHQLSSLTTPYSCLYQPSIAPGVDQPTRIAAIAAWARFCRPSGTIRFDALPAHWDGIADLEAGGRAAGMIPLRFDHFGNWSEDVAGRSWQDYLLTRPGALRETIRRRSQRAEQRADARFDLFTGPQHVNQAMAAFEAVYQRSWKQPEPFPNFNGALMRAVAESGWLRLGVWSIGTVPIAVQFWVVNRGHATLLKLAHDEAFKTHSPGTVLTALMVRRLLDQEHVTRIDFGRGDDPYKQGWAADRQQRIGLLLVDPFRSAGMAAILRQAAGRCRAALRSTTQPRDGQ